MTAIVNYVRESIQELELVRWPTRQQAIRLSIVVFVFTLVSAFAFGAVDLVLSRAVYFLTNSL